jgi:hypothetical protein
MRVFRFRIEEWESKRDGLRLLVVWTGILSFSFFASTSGGPVRLFGVQLPEVCIFRLTTGFDCPGCGLTRALIFAVQGDFYHSYLMHIWGVPLAAILLIHFFRAGIGLFATVPSLPQFPERFRRWASPFIILSLLLPWVVKTVILAAIRFL